MTFSLNKIPKPANSSLTHYGKLQLEKCMQYLNFHARIRAFIKERHSMFIRYLKYGEKLNF